MCEGVGSGARSALWFIGKARDSRSTLNDLSSSGNHATAAIMMRKNERGPKNLINLYTWLTNSVTHAPIRVRANIIHKSLDMWSTVGRLSPTIIGFGHARHWLTGQSGPPSDKRAIKNVNGLIPTHKYREPRSLWHALAPTGCDCDPLLHDICSF